MSGLTRPIFGIPVANPNAFQPWRTSAGSTSRSGADTRSRRVPRPVLCQ